MGIAEVLTLIFLVLKLTGQIDWAWWQVLLPEMIALVLYAVVFLTVVIFNVKLYKSAKRKYGKKL